VNEPFRDNASPYDKDNLLAWSEELVLVEQYLKETHLEESWDDDVVIGTFPSPMSWDPVLIEVLDFTLIPSPLLTTTPSYAYIRCIPR